MKTCINPNCTQINPQPESNFYPRPDNKIKLLPHCKKCHAIRCLPGQAKYKKNNAKLLSKKAMEHARKDIQKRRATGRRFRRNHSERLKQEQRDAYKKDPSSYKLSNKKHCQKYSDKINAYFAKRRALKLQRTPKWLTIDDFRFMKLFYTEAAILYKKTGIKYHVDHIVPLQGKNVSGLHVPWNLQLLTGFENCSKNNKF